MDKRGARRKLTPETLAVITKSVAAGLPLKYAAVKAGVCQATLYEWLKSGRADDPDPLYAEFLEKVEQARVRALDLRIRRISAHGKNTPKADQWWIENMFPDEFGANKRLIQDMVDRVDRLTAELETLRAESRRNKRTAIKRRKNRRPPPAEDGSHI